MAESYDYMAGTEMDVKFHPDNNMRQLDLSTPLSDVRANVTGSMGSENTIRDTMKYHDLKLTVGKSWRF